MQAGDGTVQQLNSMARQKKQNTISQQQNHNDWNATVNYDVLDNLEEKSV